MRRRRSHRHSDDKSNRNRRLDRRLWDADGVEWEQLAASFPLPQLEAEGARLHEPGVIFALNDYGGPLRWLSLPEAEQLIDRLLLDASMPVPPYASLWKDHNGRRLVLLEIH